MGSEGGRNNGGHDGKFSHRVSRHETTVKETQSMKREKRANGHHLSDPLSVCLSVCLSLLASITVLSVAWVAETHRAVVFEALGLLNPIGFRFGEGDRVQQRQVHLGLLNPAGLMLDCGLMVGGRVRQPHAKC